MVAFSNREGAVSGVQIALLFVGLPILCGVYALLKGHSFWRWFLVSWPIIFAVQIVVVVLDMIFGSEASGPSFSSLSGTLFVLSMLGSVVAFSDVSVATATRSCEAQGH